MKTNNLEIGVRQFLRIQEASTLDVNYVPLSHRLKLAPSFDYNENFNNLLINRQQIHQKFH